MKIKNKPNKKNFTPWIVGGITLLLIGIYIVAALLLHLPPFTSSSRSSSSSPTDQYVNMDRTDTEKQASKSIEDDPSKKVENNQTDTPSTPSGSTSTGKQNVNVLLTNAGIFNGTVSASGVVTNIVEEGGNCTYLFTNGSSTVTKNSSTLTNSTSTTCKTVSFPSSELTKSGTWTVQITYDSLSFEGVSNTKEFNK